MKTYLKTLERMYKKHIMRFLSIIFIVVVSVGLVSGIGSSTEYIKSSLNEYYKTQNVSDFVVKSTEGSFSDEQLEAVKDEYGADCVNTGMSLDVNMTFGEEKVVARLYFLDFSHWTVNLPRSVSGKTYREIAEGTGEGIEILCADSSTGFKTLALDSEVTFDFKDILLQVAEQAGEEMNGQVASRLDNLAPRKATVAGVVVDALAFTDDGEPSYIQEEGAVTPDMVNALDSLNTIDYILYAPVGILPKYREILTEQEAALAERFPAMVEQMLGGATLDDAMLPAAGDIYLAVSDRTLYSSFSQKYETYIDENVASLKALLKGEGEEDVCEVITLYDNYSFSSLNAYADKVLALSVVLLVAFVLVTALVVSSNMTRLMDEERAQIACLRTLGYSGFKIITKYMLFALIATGIAGVASYFLGMGLAAFVYYVFNYSYVMPPLTMRVAMLFYLVTYFAIAAAIIASTLIAGLRLVSEKPASLLRPRPPKAGRKVFLEHIPFLWNRLSFKYKSTVRNVLRYRNRFYMTVVAVACSMGLVLAGLALLDMCIFQEFGSAAIIGLAFVIVIFAGLLTMAVIYTLTGINISERNREIATLMVLGYQDREVTGYIYREVYINTVIGIVFGYPVGALLIWVVFKVMNFGTLGGVSWFMWLIAPFVVLLFTALVTLILRRKIVKIDMNESLKANE